MMLFVALILLIAMFAVQRAIPIVAAGAVAWGVWHATHDVMATGLSGLAALILTAGLIDGATNASSPAVRLIARGIDCCAGIAASMFLAWSFTRAFGGEDQPADDNYLRQRRRSRTFIHVRPLSSAHVISRVTMRIFDTPSCSPLR